MNQKLAIAFQTDKPLSHYGELAHTAESYGFGTLTVYNDLLYQPAWLPLMEIARHTTHARIGVAAVNPFTCHPINIAGNIALIDEAAHGHDKSRAFCRTYLGLARGAWLDFIGVEPQRPLTALREAFAAIRHLLSGTTEPLPGDIFPLAGGDTLRWPIQRPEIPFLLGTWGRQTIKHCAGYAQEIKLGGTANPDILPVYQNYLHQLGAAHIGLVVGAVTVVDEDGAAAKALARREVALYLPVVAQLDKTLTIEPQILTGIQTAAADYDFARAARFISDDLLRKFAFAGTPAEIITQTEALLDAGAARVEFGTPHGLTAQSGLKLLGEQVLPAISA